jgi:hypothetical protein
MTLSQRIGIFLLVWFIGLCAFEVGERLSIPGVVGIITSAEAVVGRPLTPVSIAGVGRRTARRCAVGVYNC